jgi:hypothetical protein
MWSHGCADRVATQLAAIMGGSAGDDRREMRIVVGCAASVLT